MIERINIKNVAESVKFSRGVEKVRFDLKTPETVVFDEKRPISEEKEIPVFQIETIVEEKVEESMEKHLDFIHEMFDEQEQKFDEYSQFKIERVD
jgi:mevalonate kinase